MTHHIILWKLKEELTDAQRERLVAEGVRFIGDRVDMNICVSCL